METEKKTPEVEKKPTPAAELDTALSRDFFVIKRVKIV